jgi:hypothetical protein
MLQVIELNVSTAAVDPQKTRDITEGDSFDIEYSYSVKWKPVTIKFSDRMDRYSRYSFLPQHLEVGRLCSSRGHLTVKLVHPQAVHHRQHRM